MVNLFRHIPRRNHLLEATGELPRTTLGHVGGTIDREGVKGLNRIFPDNLLILHRAGVPSRQPSLFDLNQ